MNLDKIHSVYLLGIGGIGMSALARYFNSLGKKVYGYDKTPSPLTDKLIQEGCTVHYDSEVSTYESFQIKGDSLFIYTPAIKTDNVLFDHIEKEGHNWYKRSQVLGLISNNTFTIAVAGTHGKTTTSSMIAHLLKENNINFTAFLGGIASNFDTNYVRYTEGVNYMEDKELTVVEADEFDKSFLHLKPNISILTSTDADHLDIYGDAGSLLDTFKEFMSRTNPTGIQIIQESLDLPIEENTITYGPSGTAHYTLNNNTPFSYDFGYANLKLDNIECGLPGIHNVENSVAAITAILPIVDDTHLIKEALYSFKGVKRRFEIAYKSDHSIVIDDYAHHPTELEKFISSVKMMYPNRAITGVFQPHLFSRTKDFHSEFAKSLSKLDTCFLLPIYPARELPIEGVNSEWLDLSITSKTHEVLSKEDLLREIENKTPSILLIMGAGDIDRLVEPIVQIYHDKES